MRVWIGHWSQNPEDWFIVWAKDKREAVQYLDGAVAEPDLDSLMELRDYGYVEFSPKKSKEGEHYEYVPNEMSFGNFRDWDDVEKLIDVRRKLLKSKE